MVQKKSTRRAPGKPVENPAAAKADCGCGCGCCGGKKRILICLLKTLMLIVLIAVVSALTCKFMCGRHMLKKSLLREPVIFRDGCVDLSEVKCPEKLKELAALDANGDGCISKDEFAARPGPEGACCQQPQPQNRPRRPKRVQIPA